jgi:NDP-sugar pyrophosphorylase family protein
MAGDHQTGRQMNRSYTVVMLAGGLHPSPLVKGLQVPPLCLPLGPQRTLLGAWLAAIGNTPGCTDVHIVVNTETDALAIRRLGDIDALANGSHVAVSAEPASWRGTGGLLRDLTRDVSPDGVVVAVEAHCVPPASLDALLEALEDDGTDAVVGAAPNHEPAGLYAFKPEAIHSIPSVGYFDLKEQLFPILNDRGRPTRLVRMERCVIRLRERAGYLEAVRASLGETGSRCSSRATISPSARIVGPCIIGPDAVIEDDAIINESVVLPGAVVGRGAVVSRSVVAPGAVLSAGDRLVDAILTLEAGSHEAI